MGVYISRTCFPDVNKLCYQVGNVSLNEQHHFVFGTKKERVGIFGCFSSVKGMLIAAFYFG